MDVFKVIEFHLEEIFFPEYLLLQVTTVKDDDIEPFNITITRFAMSLVIRLYNTKGKITEEYEFLETKKAIKKLKYILTKNEKKINAVVRMISGNSKIFTVDVFQNHNLAYSFQSSYEETQELIVCYSLAKKEIDYDEFLNDFKTILKILNNEKAIYKVIDNPYALVRKIKLKSIREKLNFKI